MNTSNFIVDVTASHSDSLLITSTITHFHAATTFIFVHKHEIKWL